jgi:hypothetical protein
LKAPVSEPRQAESVPDAAFTPEQIKASRAAVKTLGIPADQERLAKGLRLGALLAKGLPLN